MTAWTRDQKIAVITLIIAILGCIGTYMVVPEFREFLKFSKNNFPSVDSSSEPPYQSYTTKGQSFGGIWKGTVEQGRFSYNTVIILDSCTENKVCGTVDYPGLSCGGVITFLGRSDSTIHLRENISYGFERCEKEAFIDLVWLEDLKWKASYSWPADSLNAEAILLEEK